MRDAVASSCKEGRREGGVRGAEARGGGGTWEPVLGSRYWGPGTWVPALGSRVHAGALGRALCRCWLCRGLGVVACVSGLCRWVVCRWVVGGLCRWVVPVGCIVGWCRGLCCGLCRSVGVIVSWFPAEDGRYPPAFSCLGLREPRTFLPH